MTSTTPAASFGPQFLERLADPRIETVFVAGCGGGFDFVHSFALYPWLVGRGKRVIVGSYSFGDPAKIRGGEVIFSRGDAVAKRVTAACEGDRHYCPEVHVCSFLDEEFPAAAPHQIYAYYARAFTVPLLTSLYDQIVAQHGVDAIVVVDGGSDSLMRGDEAGLGDPVEDCVSVTTAAGLEGVRERLLLTIGLGCDRFNDVSDAASLRAISELTADGAFLGVAAIHDGGEPFAFYRRLVDHIEVRQTFRSVLAGAIISAAEGGYAAESVPPRLASRVRTGQLFLSPLMPLFWGFDILGVARRSLMSGWIAEQTTVWGCHDAIARGRRGIARGVRPVENLPPHERPAARR